MDSNVRRRNRAPQLAGGGGGGPGGDNLDALREEGEGLLAAGDSAIDRTLSGNSERFLMGNIQGVGE